MLFSTKKNIGGTMCTGDYLEIVGATTFCGAKEKSGRVCGAVFTTTAHSTGKYLLKRTIKYKFIK